MSSKVLECIQLCAGKYILGCSMTTCDEPVHADLDFKTWKVEEIFANWNGIVKLSNWITEDCQTYC